jgi:hypothetical protein
MKMLILRIKEIKFLTIKIITTDRQEIELKRLHDTTRDGRVRDRIKAILLSSEGWSSAMVAQALRLHETTINRNISDYLNHRSSNLKTATLPNC